MFDADHERLSSICFGDDVRNDSMLSGNEVIVFVQRCFLIHFCSVAFCVLEQVFLPLAVRLCYLMLFGEFYM